MNNTTTIHKPFLKWVGGKTQILDKVLNLFPKNIDTYHEIFLGGGSVLLGFLSRVESGIINMNRVCAYDLNEALIYTYKNIQTNPHELYEDIQKITNEYFSCSLDKVPIPKDKSTLTHSQSLQSREMYYYYCRNMYNNIKDKTSIMASSYFIFLNKTCFRGLYRTRPNGFNVPYGNYKKPTIINKNHLTNISKLIQNVEFICMDFTNSLCRIEANDFVYMDPPYVPENKSSFVKYINEFNLDTHIRLFEECIRLRDRGIKFVMSNSHTKLVVEYFEKFNIDIINCRRSINSKNPESTTNEVLIYV